MYEHIAGKRLFQQMGQLRLKPACVCRVQGAPVVHEWELRLLELLLTILSADLQPASSGGAAISDILHDADHGQHRLMVGRACLFEVCTGGVAAWREGVIPGACSGLLATDPTKAFSTGSPGQ